MGGDVVGILGTSYDVTFRLPNVPPGTYELRLGYTALESRGIVSLCGIAAKADVVGGEFGPKSQYIYAYTRVHHLVAHSLVVSQNIVHVIIRYV